MKALDRTKFFAGYHDKFGSLTQPQVDALNKLLDAFEADTDIEDIRWVAYMLATFKHETANTFEPIEEYGKGRGHSYGVLDPITRQTYYGRGLVQLTWSHNYKTFGDKLGVDLLNHPELALEFETAYRIASLGMREGLFTGKSLARYVGPQGCDYVSARRIINALDQATKIADYAERFESIIQGAL